MSVKIVTTKDVVELATVILTAAKHVEQDHCWSNGCHRNCEVCPFCDWCSTQAWNHNREHSKTCPTRKAQAIIKAAL